MLVTMQPLYWPRPYCIRGMRPLAGDPYQRWRPTSPTHLSSFLGADEHRNIRRRRRTSRRTAVVHFPECRLSSRVCSSWCCLPAASPYLVASCGRSAPRPPWQLHGRQSQRHGPLEHVWRLPARVCRSLGRRCRRRSSFAATRECTALLPFDAKASCCLPAADGRHAFVSRAAALTRRMPSSGPRSARSS